MEVPSLLLCLFLRKRTSPCGCRGPPSVSMRCPNNDRNGGKQVFDSKSDYALNKMDPEAIVCKSSTGIHIRLTCEDFASEEDFRFWKAWTDNDYHNTDRAGRSFYDHCIALNEALDSAGLSIEDVLLAPLLRTEEADQRISRIQIVRDILTEKQYRRLRLYYLDGMTEAEIADIEGVGQQRISKSLISGITALKNFIKIFQR